MSLRISFTKKRDIEEILVKLTVSPVLFTDHQETWAQSSTDV